MYDVEGRLSTRNLNAYIGKKLKERRSALKITQMKLSRMIGVSIQQLQKYESGANNISLAALYKISKALNADAGYFFEGYGADLADRDSHVQTYEIQSADKEVILLSKYFKKINNEEVRKKILSLVKSLSGMGLAEIQGEQ